MRYEVYLTADAEVDVARIHHYIATQDSPVAAERVLQRLAEVSRSLAEQPERGSVPKELRQLGIADYRQVFFKPWRVIYRVHDDLVIIYLMADGRRDLQSLLARRLLGS